jgi:hypothetical protein
LDEYAKMNQAQREWQFDRVVRRLAQLDQQGHNQKMPESSSLRNPPTRRVRSLGDEPAKGELEDIRILAPFAFSARLNQGVALGTMILSPHAFVSEVLAPEVHCVL